MDAATRLSDVLAIADAFQRLAGGGNLLMQMRDAECPRSPWSGSEIWRRSILRTQIAPVYRAIIAARVHQRAPSEAMHAAVLLWFRAAWATDPQAPEKFGGWPRPVLEPLTGWRGAPRPKSPNKKEVA